MATSAALSVGLTRTPARGWAVALSFRLQTSSIMLTSFTLGVFLPFIRRDLQLLPLHGGTCSSLPGSHPRARAMEVLRS